MPLSSTIVGIDLVPIKPIRGVITLTEDITTDKCRSAIKRTLPPGGLFDVVVCDGAPNVGGAWSAEAYSQAALVLEACKLATDFLAPRGLFITKVFRSPEYHALLYAFHQLFDKVESTKPLASRATSAEIYVACHGFKAPGRLDKRLLDPAHLFAAVEGGGGVGPGAGTLGAGGAADGAGFGADVLRGKDGELKRNRGGYDTASGVLFKRGDAEGVFIGVDTVAAATAALSQHNALSLSPALVAHEATTPEVVAALEDLRVLGRRDFRALLKWRETVRKSRAADAKRAAAEEEEAAGGGEGAGAAGAEGEECGEEASLAAEMGSLRDRADARARRAAKSKSKAASKARARAAVGAAGAGGGATAAAARAAEGGAFGTDAELFALSKVSGGEAALRRVTAGEGDDAAGDALFGSIAAEEGDAPPPDDDAPSGSDGDDDAELAAELDRLYEAYAARRGAKSMEAPRGRGRRAKLGDGELPAEDGADVPPPSGKAARAAAEEAEWDADGTALAKRSAAAAAASAAARNPLLLSLPGAGGGGMSAVAASWFSNPIFEDAERDAEQHEERRVASLPPPKRARKAANAPPPEAGGGDDDDDDIRAAARAAARGWAGVGASPGATPGDDGDFEVVPARVAAMGGEDGSGGDGDGSDSDDREMDEALDDESKAQIRAIGRLFMRRKSRGAAVEAGHHKWAWGGEDDAPPWFAADEARHCRPALPITASEAAAERAALRALDARPIKKVAEAKARKKKKAAARLDAARKAASAIAEQEDVPLASRMRQIERVYAKSARKGAGKPQGKGDKKAGGKAGSKGAKLDPRMRKDSREVNTKKKREAAKVLKRKNKRKAR